MTDYSVKGTLTGEGIVGEFTGTVTIADAPVPPEPPNPEPPSGGSELQYQYYFQYADTGNAVPADFKRIINANTVSQNGVGLNIAPGPWPPNYRVSDGKTVGGVYPPSGQQSDGTKPIRLQPPASGDGLKFQFFSTMTITVINDSDTDGKFVWGLGVSSVGPDVNRPLGDYLGVLHIISDFRKMAPITIPKRSAVSLSTFRLDVLDPAFAPIATWPKWNLSTNANDKLYSAITPTCINPGSVPLNIRDIVATSYAIMY